MHDPNDTADSPPASGTSPWGVAAACGVAIGAVALGLMYRLDQPAMLTFDNAGSIFPLTLEAQRAIMAGRLPEWSDRIWGGIPIIGQGLAGALYLPHLLAVALTPAPHLRAFDVGAALHAGWLAAGSVALLSALRVSRPLAVTGALLAVLSPLAITTGMRWMPAYAALAWWPWALLAAERLATQPLGRGWAMVLLGAVALAGQALAGCLALAGSCGLVVTALIALRRSPVSWAARIMRILLVTTGGLALAAPTALPMIALAGADAQAGGTGLGQLMWTDLPTLPANAGLRALNSIGVATVVLAMLGATRRGGLGVLLGAVALVAFVPQMPMARESGALVGVLGAWLATIGATVLVSRRPRHRVLAAIGAVALSVAVLERVAALVVLLPAQTRASASPVGLVAVRTEIARLRLPEHEMGPGPPPLLFAPPADWLHMTGGYTRSIPAIDGLATIEGGRLPFLGRHRDIDLALTPGARGALDLLGVTTLVVDADRCRRVSDALRLPVLATGERTCVIANPSAHPRYEIVSTVLGTPTRTNMLSSMRLAPDGPIPVARPPAAVRREGDAEYAGDATLRRYVPGDVQLAVRAEQPGFLLVRHAWSPGWQVTLDGRAVRVHPAAGPYFGIVVPRGPHTVRLRYRTPGLRAGLTMAAAWLILVASVTVVRRRRGQPV